MFKLLILLAVVYGVYRYSDVIHKLTAPKSDKLEGKDDFTDYEELD